MGFRFAVLIASIMFAMLSATLPVQAEKRVALVVGNERYANLAEREQLQKAVGDARAVGRALGRIGFEVIAGENLGRQALIDKLDEVARRLSSGDTVFFFFSGHGVALDGANYILPADVPDVGAGQITRLTGAALAEDYITTELLRSGARVAVVVLDACRNNPFARSGTKGVGGEKGLQPREPPSGVFTFYAAGRGERALDRLYDGDRDPNSVFTRALLPALTRPGLDLPALAVEVREQVTRLARSAKHEQKPAYYDGTSGGRIFLAGLPVESLARPSGDAVAPQPAGPAPDQVAAVGRPERPGGPLGSTSGAGPCGGAATVSLSSRRPGVLSAGEECGLRPKHSFRECETCPEMVVVPTGSFTMGSPPKEEGRSNDEGPQHRVTFERPFAVGKYAVTFAEWDACVAGGGCNGYRPDDRGWGRGKQPVINVSWADAQAYVKWLSGETGKTYRLLSEAEREYVTRAGTTTPFWWGSSISPGQGNYDGNYTYGGGPKGEYRRRPLPVDSFGPNPWGLYQVHGNVWEWTADCWHRDYNGAPADGSAWTTGCEESSRVVRGGAWVGYPRDLRSAQRWDSTELRLNNLGFRLARTLTP